MGYLMDLIYFNKPANKCSKPDEAKAACWEKKGIIHETEK